ncbi:MAG: glycosyltransferase family 2 protein [Acidimicrobiales bacterium]
MRNGAGIDDGRVLWAPHEMPEPRPDASQDLARYRRWLGRRETERSGATSGRRAPASTGEPELDVVLVVHQAEPEALRTCLHSLAGQTADRWRLSVTMAGPPDPAADAVLGEEISSFSPGQVDVHRCPEGTDEASAAEVAVEASGSPCFTLLGAHDRLAPDAVSLLAGALVDADVAYADEDLLDHEGLPATPRLKPDWSPELCQSCNYVGRPVAYRQALVVAAGGVRPVPGGDWEHDLVLRVTERTDRIAHIPEVLCHRRGGARGAAFGNGAVVAALRRRGEVATVEPGPLPSTWRVRRPVGDPLVTVIVPFHNSTTFLRTCVDSVLATAGDARLEIVLVDNGSDEPETCTLLERLDALDVVTVQHDPRPFNWAALNNRAAATARGDVLLFLNDDIEAPAPGWLAALAAQAVRPEIGAAGARLVYPDGRLQFAGTVLRLGGAAGHVLAGVPGDRPGYLGMAVLTRDVTAVTGACMATRRAVFEHLGGFDEALGIDCNDVDYCLRARAAGLRVVYEPQAELVHYESPTRGMSGSGGDIIRFVDRWEESLLAGDPYLNSHLTCLDGSASLRETDELAWWQEWRAELEQAK